VGTLGLGLWLAEVAGTSGAAWGTTLGTALGSVLMLVLALRPPRRAPVKPSPGGGRVPGGAPQGEAAVAPSA
jgi:Na+-driven multidrug efflux pump